MQPDAVVERVFDLPPAIVWDAFVDPVLREGWLADGSLEQRAGGVAELRFGDTGHEPALVGRVTAIEPGRRLVIEDPDGGRMLSVRLDELPGGARGRSTRVLLELSGLGAGRALEAHWRTHLEALEDLLRGHPVHWPSWEAEYGPIARGFLAGSASSTSG